MGTNRVGLMMDDGANDVRRMHRSVIKHHMVGRKKCRPHGVDEDAASHSPAATATTVANKGIK